jgi:hypothetical protein
MAHDLDVLRRTRFVGDSEARIVHDRWHADCEDCLMEPLVERGLAVGFKPDTLDQALSEGYEYCPLCNDRSTPRRPPRGRI